MRFDFSRSGPFIGMAGMATAFFLYAWSAVVLHDVTTLVVLPLVWLVLFGLGCAWFSTRPCRVMLLPVAAVAIWFLVMLTR